MAGRARLAGIGAACPAYHQFAVYFAVLLAWAIGAAMWQHGVFDPAIVPTLMLVPLALAALGLLALFGWLAARTTTYWITNRRVVMQFGVALPMTVNIPFRLINAASVSSGADGSGDIALSLSDGDRLAYLIMWPHVRPWRLARTEPSLRGITHVCRGRSDPVTCACRLGGAAGRPGASGLCAARRPRCRPSRGGMSRRRS